MKKVIFLLLAILMVAPMANAKTEPIHPIKIEVVNKETNAVTFVEEFKNISEANETLNVFVVKDGFRFKDSFESKEFTVKRYETNSGDIITMKIANSSLFEVACGTCGPCVDGYSICKTALKDGCKESTAMCREVGDN